MNIEILEPKCYFLWIEILNSTDFDNKRVVCSKNIRSHRKMRKYTQKKKLRKFQNKQT